MHDALLIVHLLGLMMGAGGGLGSAIAMRVAAKRPPEQGAGIRSIGPALARLSTIGLVLLWITGPGLVMLTYGGFEDLPLMFWVKFAFVLSLTIAAITIELTYARVKKGDIKAAALLPRLGPIAGASAMLAMVFAVLAFH